MWKYAYPFVPHFLFAAGLASAGQFFVKHVINLEQAGLYNIAWKFCLPLILLVDAFQTAWGAYKFKVIREEKEPELFLSRSISAYMIVLSLLFIISVNFFIHFLPFYIPEEYHQAANYIPYLSLIPLAQGTYFMLSSAISFSESPRWMPFISLAGLTVAIICGYYFTQLWGVPGTGIAITTAWTTMALFGFIYANRIYPLKLHWGKIILAFVIIVGMFGLDQTLDLSRSFFLSLSLFILAILSFIVYVSVAMPELRKKIIP